MPETVSQPCTVERKITGQRVTGGVGVKINRVLKQDL